MGKPKPMGQAALQPTGRWAGVNLQPRTNPILKIEPTLWNAPLKRAGQ